MAAYNDHVYKNMSTKYVHTNNIKHSKKNRNMCLFKVWVFNHTVKIFIHNPDCYRLQLF